MALELFWHPPIALINGRKQNLIYTIEEGRSLPDHPGIYIFARSFGTKIAPLYVGQAKKISIRVKQQFQGNVPLMKAIEKAAIGKRILMVGELRSHSGLSLGKSLNVIESTFMQYFLAEGYDLLNKLGTRKPVYVINSSGNQVCNSLFPCEMTHQR